MCTSELIQDQVSINTLETSIIFQGCEQSFYAVQEAVDLELDHLVKEGVLKAVDYSPYSLAKLGDTNHENMTLWPGFELKNHGKESILTTLALWMGYIT